MKSKRTVDPATTIIPMIIIVIMCVLFVATPNKSTIVLTTIRSFLEDGLGIYYLAVGLGVLIFGIVVSFSKIGSIVLGEPNEKPQYGFWSWGGMMFTAGLAADILFYSFCEWMLYANESRVSNLGSIQDWASTFPLFHWGPIPWGFYATLAAAFGFMLHVRKVNKQKYSEACRPILRDRTDGFIGKIIDVLAVFALIAGTATTFSLATPLLSSIISTLLGVSSSKWITIAILIIVCITYTSSVMHGINGIKTLSATCMYIFIALMIFVLVFGGQTMYILETGFSAIGNMVQNFIGLSTYTDPLRETGFAQNWTIFYWAYWMVWCVAAPFFMGSISRGRTVRQVILGCFGFGMGSTFMSFIVFGNYGLGIQMKGKYDFLSEYAQSGDLYQSIISVIRTLPLSTVVMILIVISMMAFYATSFDSITMVASQYSYKSINSDEKAGKGMTLFWAMLLIILPIALIFNESSMNNLQTVSLIAAFPIGFVIILILASFIKDARDYMEEKKL